jgi:hypothetical protein
VRPQTIRLDVGLGDGGYTFTVTGSPQTPGDLYACVVGTIAQNEKTLLVPTGAYEFEIAWSAEQGQPDLIFTRRPDRRLRDEDVPALQDLVLSGLVHWAKITPANA